MMLRIGGASTLLALVASAGIGGGGSAQEQARGQVAAAADHHTHIRSAAGGELLLRVAEAVEQDIGNDDGGAVTAEDLIAAMDGAGVRQAQVLSVAYFFGFPDLDLEDREASARAENDWVAEQVARFPDRLFGACSVNPLDGFAPAEVRRCAGDDRLVGLKLHFANSDVDLRDPEHVARVAEVFRVAGEGDLPVVVHLRTRAPDYGATDVRVFIDQVLSQAPDLPVQVAHMAGWGGYDAATDEALGTFVEAFRDGTLDPDRFTFDLAAVVVPPALAGADTAMVANLTKANAMLTERIREIGLGRVVFATDWNSLPMAGYLWSLPGTLSLTPEELADVLDNVGPMIRAGTRGEDGS